MSCLCAAYTSFIVNKVLSDLNDSHALALIITDNGIVSDDANLQNNLSSSTAALRYSYDISIAIIVSCLMIGLSLAYRQFKLRA